MSERLILPRVTDNRYPQRAHEHLAHSTRIGVALHHFRAVRGVTSVAERIVEQSATLMNLDDRELRTRARVLRPRLARASLDDEATIQAVSSVSEAARRTLGMVMTVPLTNAGLALLIGTIVDDRELGADSTDVIGVVAATLALAGVPVHVISLDNDLAERDMRRLSPLYRALGMSAGLVTSAMAQDARAVAYRSPIVYCDYRQLASDYLCDQAVLRRPSGVRQQFRQLSTEATVSGELLLPGLICGLVSDPDAILIDAANEVVSAPPRALSYDDRRKFGTALNLASRLSETTDYEWHKNGTDVELTATGNRRIAARALELGGLWYRPLRRDEVVRLATIALYGCERGTHYHVDDGMIRLSSGFIDESRLGEQRLQDLVQLLSIKEGCELRASGGDVTLSYRRFLRRYLRIAGLSPVASLIRQELAVQYGLPVETCHSLGRNPATSGQIELFHTLEEKSAALIEAVEAATTDMEQVLILCNSMDAAGELADSLHGANITAQVIAGQDPADDARKLAEARKIGIVSIIANYSGAAIPEQTNKCPEFHIIVAELCSHRERIKLVAACGQQVSRQQQLVSLDEPFMLAVTGQLELALMRRYFMTDGKIKTSLVIIWLRRKALLIDKLQKQSRRDLQEFSDRLDQQLTFSTGTR